MNAEPRKISGPLIGPIMSDEIAHPGTLPISTHLLLTRDSSNGQKRKRCLTKPVLEKTKKTSVVDKTGLAWGAMNPNLGNASNPTLTVACHAISGARRMLAELNEEEK